MRDEPSDDIRPEDSRRPDVQALLGQSDDDLRALYPAESNHLVSADVLGTDRAVFLAARRHGELVGSIALLVIAPGHAEMKKMFVLTEARGIGLGRRWLNALEEVALLRGALLSAVARLRAKADATKQSSLSSWPLDCFARARNDGVRPAAAAATSTRERSVP
jgi:GNAT superfamily N-acetyltransferase